MNSENITENTFQYYAQLRQILTLLVSSIRWLYTDDNLSLFLWETAAKAAKPLVAAYVAGEVGRNYSHKLEGYLQPNIANFYTDVETNPPSTNY